MLWQFQFCDVHPQGCIDNGNVVDWHVMDKMCVLLEEQHVPPNWHVITDCICENIGSTGSLVFM